jgi:hypothetical protein
VGYGEYQIGGNQKPGAPSDFIRGGLADESSHLLMESLSYLIRADFCDATDLVGVLGVIDGLCPGVLKVLILIFELTSDCAHLISVLNYIIFNRFVLSTHQIYFD